MSVEDDIARRQRLMALYQIEHPTDAELIERVLLAEQPVEIPKCKTCGGELSPGKMGGGEPTEWYCSTQEEDPADPRMLRYKEGRSFMDDHWRQSLYVQRYHPNGSAFELATRFQARLAVPSLKIEELTTRHSEFLAAIRRVVNSKGTAEEMEERVVTAQREYIEWFAERGITATGEGM